MGTESLYRIGRDGKGLRRLTFPQRTEDTHCQTDPTPSPAARLIAFADWTACDHGTDSRIAGITATGRPARLPFRFPDVRVVADPAWAPDGRAMAFTTGDVDAWGGAPETLPDAIYVSSSDGSQPRRVGPTDSRDGSPAWSPDSNWIVFSRGRSDNCDIWIVHRGGTGPRKVTNGKPDDGSPAWLPAAP